MKLLSPNVLENKCIACEFILTELSNSFHLSNFLGPVVRKPITLTRGYILIKVS